MLDREFGLPRASMVQATLRLLGFRRNGARLVQAAEQAIDWLVLNELVGGSSSRRMNAGTQESAGRPTAPLRQAADHHHCLQILISDIKVHRDAGTNSPDRSRRDHTAAGRGMSFV